MKLGTENKKQLIVLGVLGALAVVMLARQFWPSAAAPAVASAPVSSSTKPMMKRLPSGKIVPVMEPRLDPTLDLNLLSRSEQIKYAGNGRNIFVLGSQPVLPTPKGNGTTDHDGSIHVPQGPPPPPPIDLKFFGFANKPGEPKRVFLVKGEDIFVAGEGDIVNRRYRVLRINPNAVELEDVLYNNRQMIPLTQG